MCRKTNLFSSYLPNTINPCTKLCRKQTTCNNGYCDTNGDCICYNDAENGFYKDNTGNGENVNCVKMELHLL